MSVWRAFRGAALSVPLVLMTGQTVSGPAVAAADDMTVAILQGLDKITARVTTIDAPLGETIKFGTLEIVARRCVTRPPEEPPESTVFIEITERQPGEEAKALYAGWMFASSPAVSSMQHPVYDVWVISCKKASSSG